MKGVCPQGRWPASGRTLQRRIGGASGSRVPAILQDRPPFRTALIEVRKSPDLHEHPARVALAAAGPFGFALAGGYAVQAHGFLDRPSADVDIFTTSRAEGDFPAAVDAVLAALRGDGLVPEAEIRNASFARIAVATPDGGTTKIEMGVDWRANQPSRLSIGPVLHPDDAVANKVCVLFGRAEVRDYVDVDAIVSSGRYSEAHPRGVARSGLRQAVVRRGTGRRRPTARRPVPAL